MAMLDTVARWLKEGWRMPRDYSEGVGEVEAEDTCHRKLKLLTLQVR